MIQRQSQTTVLVLNHAEALTFYRDSLGFEVRMDMAMEGSGVVSSTMISGSGLSVTSGLSVMFASIKRRRIAPSQFQCRSAVHTKPSSFINRKICHSNW